MAVDPVSIIGIALSAVGTVQQMSASKRQAKASRRAEELRQKQMNLDALRQKRKIIRQAAIERAKVVSAGGQQGLLESSAVQGSLGSISSITAGNTRDVNQNVEIGAGLFQQNANIAEAQSAAAFGQGLSTVGGTIVQNAGTINKTLKSVFGS